MRSHSVRIFLNIIFYQFAHMKQIGIGQLLEHPAATRSTAQLDYSQALEIKRYALGSRNERPGYD
jgi:hypothetical protein